MQMANDPMAPMPQMGGPRRRALRPINPDQQPRPVQPQQMGAPAGPPQAPPAAQAAPQPAPQPAPTFAQMQAAGQARPAPPAPPAAPQPPAYGGRLSQSILEALNNPSGYGQPQVMDTYHRLGQSIDDDFTRRERATDEQFARRGLYDSTAAAGAMHDLNVGRRSAHEDLAAQLADRQAQDYASARQGAIGQGLQGLGQSLQEALGYGNLNLANRSLDQQGQLATRGYDLSEQQGKDSRTVQLLQLLAALGLNPQGA